MAATSTPDVVVVGGGPAGSAAAAMLVRQGWSVLVLERDRFPRDHVGESLLPASVPVLEELGVRDAVEEAGFLRKWGATMVWGRDRAPWSWYFRETNTVHPHAWQVWRPEFDRLLLDNARSSGADVREGHRVVEVDASARRVRFEADDGSAGEVAARFVVDASGQSALLGNALRLRRWDPVFRNTAVYAYFAGAARLPSPDETNILVESYPDGWFWAIPLHTGWTSVGAVVDRDVVKGRLRKQGLTTFLRDHVARAPHTSRMLAGAKLVHGPFVLRDWSYVSDRFVGDGYVLAGDAACFVDPLFSSGVHLALSAGVLAAAYVTSALRDEDLARAAAPVYTELYMTQYRRFHEMAKLFYASNRTQESYFWEARRVIGERDAGPREAFVRAVAGQPPQGYERVVLERGETPSDFAAGVRAIENAQSGRAREVASPDALLDAVPHLGRGVEVSVSPVLGAGAFEWGHVVRSPSRPEGTPVSGLVAEALRRVDGRASVRQIASSLSARLSRADLDRAVVFAMRTLYVEGVIDELVAR